MKLGRKKLGVNFIFQLLYQLLVMLVPLITAPYLSRTLGADAIGIYAYNYAVAYYFVLFTKLGIDNYGAKVVASIGLNSKVELSKTFWELFFTKCILGILSLSIYLIYVFRFNVENKSIALIFGGYIFSAIIDINWFFIGIEEFKLISIRNTLLKIFSVICIFLFVKDSNDLDTYTCIMVFITYVLSQFIGWGYVIKSLRFEKVHLYDLHKHLKPLVVLFVPVLAMSIYRQMDKIMLGNMSTNFQVGLYEYTEKIYMVLMCVVSVTGDVGMPRVVSLLATNERTKAYNLINIFVDFAICLSCGMAFGISAISHHFIPLFYGSEFAQCSELLMLLAPTIIFLAISVIIRKEFLIPCGHEKVFIIATALGAVINFSLNYILILKFEAEGSIIATLCTELFVMVFQLYFVKRWLPIKSYLKNIIRFTLAGTIMWITIRYIWPQQNANWLVVGLEIVFGVIIYGLFTMIFIMKYYRHEIIRVVRRVLKR